jgi:hypothetical protein
MDVERGFPSSYVPFAFAGNRELASYNGCTESVTTCEYYVIVMV